METETVNVAMYPNPAKESVVIMADGGLRCVNVYNLLGQQVAMMESHGENKCTIATNDMTPGIYVVKITTGKGVATQRLMVR